MDGAGGCAAGWVHGREEVRSNGRGVPLGSLEGMHTQRPVKGTQLELRSWKEKLHAGEGWSWGLWPQATHAGSGEQ